MMQSGARVGLSVGVLVLVSTANWQGTQPHSTRFTTAPSIESDIYLWSWVGGNSCSCSASNALSLGGAARVVSAVSFGLECYWPLACSK